MENSNVMNQQYEENQQEISLMQQQYEEVQQNLVSELDSARESGSKQATKINRLEQVVEQLQDKNRLLNEQVLAIKHSKDQQQEMLNILSSQDIDDSDLSETNKQLEVHLKASKNNEKLKDEVRDFSNIH